MLLARRIGFLFFLSLTQIIANGDTLSLADRELTTVRELNALLNGPTSQRHAFTITGLVTRVERQDNSAARQALILRDETGIASLINVLLTPIGKGDIAVIKGVAYVTSALEPWMDCWRVTKIGESSIPPTLDVPLSKLSDKQFDLKSVRTKAIVIEVMQDEISPECDYLILKDGETIFPSVRAHNVSNKNLIDAEIIATGILHRYTGGQRKFLGPSLHIDSIEVTTPPPDDSFDFPHLENVIYISPTEVMRLGKRSISGTVLAQWQGKHFLLHTDDDRLIRVELANGATLPGCGSSVKVVGYPTTDLFRLNLSRANVRIQQPPPSTNHPKESVVDEKEILNPNGNNSFNNEKCFGKLASIQGIIRKVSTPESHDKRMILSCGEFDIPVDYSDNPTCLDNIIVGSKIRVTGRCILEIDRWQPGDTMPHINGLIMVIRSANDIVLIARPPWWTPGRLMTVIGIILAVLLATFIWVATLHRLAERRGHDLYMARQAKEEERQTRELAELRMQDRTRLAVELHDTISQNLTGATMQMGTAAQLVETDHVKAIRHLDIATRTLDSCREELRNCIWDLRNNALDVPDLNEAIRMTLQRLTGGAKLQIRFNIPREKLPDNTVHALMRIIRELATNAVRHGAARTIRIAGALDNGILSFSVTDDGKGFDPENRPGLAEGHFGLQGVEERVEELGGEIKISSKIGKGTRVKVWIKSEC